MTAREVRDLFKDCVLPYYNKEARPFVGQFLKDKGFDVRVMVPMRQRDRRGCTQYIEIYATKDDLKIVVEVDRKYPGPKGRYKFQTVPDDITKICLLRNHEHPQTTLEDGTIVISLDTETKYDLW